MVATVLAGSSTAGCTKTSTSACRFLIVILPMLPTTTSSIITGEFDSSEPTLASSIWKLDARGPCPTVPGSGSEVRPWNAHPVAINVTRVAVPSTRRTGIQPIILAALLREAAWRAGLSARVVVVGPVLWAPVGTASPHQVSAPGGPAPGGPLGHRGPPGK